MRNLVLISELPGSGKTTLAKYLHKELKIPLIVKDEIKEILFDTVGFKSRTEKVNLSIASMNIMYNFADMLLSLNMSLILENNFENISKSELLELIKKHDCNVILIKLKGDMHEIYKRFTQRDQTPERHRGHVINTKYPEKASEKYVPMGYENFKKMCNDRGINTFEVSGELVEVDVTDFTRISYEKIANLVETQMIK